jgi:hypothetical protein
MILKKHAPHLIGSDNRFSDKIKILRKQRS